MTNEKFWDDEWIYLSGKWFEYKHLKTNDKNLPWDQDYFPTTKQEVVQEVEMTRRMNYLIFLKDPEE